MIKLGSKVRDTRTGFSGIANARADYMYGCSRIQIEPEKLDKDGKPIEAHWFDEQRVEVIVEEAPKISKDSGAISGGPQCDSVLLIRLDDDQAGLVVSARSGQIVRRNSVKEAGE